MREEMTTMLQEAIAAARAGEMEQAQMLAAGYAQDHPDDPNGWYLLSQLVDSDARRAAYLSRTLALAPDHPRAQAEFAALPPALVAEFGPQPAYLAAEEVIASTIDEPSDEEVEVVVPVEVEKTAPAEVEMAPAVAVTAASWEPQAPDAMSATPAGPVAPLTPGVTPTTQTRPIAAGPRPPAAAPRSRNGGNQALTILLGLLALLAFLVLAFLVYLLVV
jgi:hypothetical protein